MRWQIPLPSTRAGVCAACDPGLAADVDREPMLEPRVAQLGARALRGGRRSCGGQPRHARARLRRAQRARATLWRSRSARACARRPSTWSARTRCSSSSRRLSRATAVLTPDSGPAHMATAVGTPVLGLYAATNPARSGPYYSRQWCVDRYPLAARTLLGREPSTLAVDHEDRAARRHGPRHRRRRRRAARRAAGRWRAAHAVRLALAAGRLLAASRRSRR